MELKRAHDGLDEKPPAAPEQKPSAKAKLAEPKSTAAMMGGMGGEITFNLGGTATWVCGALKFTKAVNPGTKEKTARKAIASQLNAPERKELEDGYEAWSAEEKRARAEVSQQKRQDADEKETMTDYLARKCKIGCFKLVPTVTYSVLNAIAQKEAKTADDENMMKMIGLDTEGPGDIPLYIQLALCTGNEYVVLIVLIADIADLETFNVQFKKFTDEHKSEVFVFGAGEYDPDPEKTPSFEMLIGGIPDDAKKGDTCINDLQVSYDDGTRQNLADALSSLSQVEDKLVKWNKNFHPAFDLGNKRFVADRRSSCYEDHRGNKSGLDDHEKYAACDAAATLALAKGDLCTNDKSGFYAYRLEMIESGDEKSP